MSIKRVLKLARRKLLYGHKATSESYINHLRSIGIEIGEGCEIFTPETTHIEENNPHLLTIGSHVAMTGPVTILCHDYSVGVTKRWSHGDVLGSQKKVTIGDNVFLGWGCTVLAGTSIGPNSVIGAGAVATGSLGGGFIYGGNPAKPICSIEEYYERRKRKQLQEAVDVYRAYKLRFGRAPEKSIFHEYFYLFTPTSDGLPPYFSEKLEDKGNAEECFEYLLQGRNDALFASYEDFAKYAEDEMRKGDEL